MVIQVCVQHVYCKVVVCITWDSFRGASDVRNGARTDVGVSTGECSVQ